MADVSEPLIFVHTVEAFFFRALEGRVTPELIHRVRATGIELDKPLLPEYPFSAWVKALDLSSELLFPGVPKAQSHRQMGRWMVESYQQTFVGKALFMGLKLLPSRQVVDRIARSFRTSNNFTETVVRDVGPNTVELDFNRVEPEPAFTQGVIEAGLPAAGVKNVAVSLIARVGESATFRVSWG